MEQKQINVRNDPLVQKAILLRKAKTSKVFTADKVIGAIAGLTGTAFGTVAMRKKREEPPPTIQQGSKKMIDIARAQGSLRPDVLERVMNSPHIIPRTLKDTRQP